ncbi:MAG: phosphoglycerate dehydrogenase [Clostridia bacterium]|nr:phosphoglycerate dehydrogenase [Clostridia bacterium]
MAYKVLVTPRSFGKTDPEVFDILANAGIELVRNDTGGILNEEQMIEKLADCDGVILGVDPMNERVLNSAPKLRAIAKYGVGVDNIDLAVAEQKGIKVTRTVGANSVAVADYAMSLLMAVTRRVVPIDAECRRDSWKKRTTIDVSGGVIGIFGLGAIGKLVAKRAQGFDMTVLAYDTFWDEEYAKANNIKRAEPEEIFKNADFISLHLPLLPETRNFIGKEQIEMMKPSAVIINTARGGIIDEDALLDALKNDRIYGAGLDAFAQEPPENKEWYTLENVVIGSHSAASTLGATKAMGRMAVKNLFDSLGI